MKSLTEQLRDLRSSDFIKCRTAREKLVDMGAEAVPGLIKELQNKNKWVRWEAAKALGEIALPESVNALVRALDDKIFDVRWLAAEALIKTGVPSIIPVLQTIVDHPASENYRDGAHHVLHDIKAEDLADILKPVIASLEDGMFAVEAPLAAKKALDSLK